MAEIKVSQLPEASEINDNDLIMIVQNGTNKKITKENCQFASGDEISIGTTEPTEDEKLWIKSDETTNQARYRDGNTFKELSIKALDSMPVGTQVEYTGDTIPAGWEQVNDYSTTEIDTGKRWINGKKIYRKSVNVSTTLTANTENRVAYLYNVDSIIDLRGTGVLSSNYFIQFPYIDDTNNMTLYVRKLTNDYAITLVPKSTAITNINIIVEYTKTS